MPRHRHNWERFQLWWPGPYDAIAEALFEEYHWRIYYTGYRCRCGEIGYAA